MKKLFCNQCQKEVSRQGFTCPHCGAINSIVEAEDGADRSGLKSSGAVTPDVRAKTIKELSGMTLDRIPTGIGELDRVLGGGFVPAEVLLLAASPGAGKSTLALDVSGKLAKQGMKVLYSSGEESEGQIFLRAERIKVNDDNIRIINETNLERLLGHIEEEEPNVVIVDSLQTIASSNVPGSIGSVQQSREAAHALTREAKAKGIIMILINQVIKGGDEFAGSNQVPHIVDATLMLESDKESPLKFLRAYKNRFGDTDQVGVFMHQTEGLVEVEDPSSMLHETAEEAHGAAITFISEGIRQLPIEIQALVIDSTAPNPRKQFNGISYNRGQIVSAILSQIARERVYEKDVFISTVAGMKTDDPQGDLAIAAALMSASQGVIIPRTTVFIGEVNLTGQIRGNFLATSKVKEAERLGFKTVVLPENCKEFKIKSNLELKYISSITELSDTIKGA